MLGSSVQRIVLAASLLGLVAGCSDETSYKDCWTYTRSDEYDDIITVEECCKTKCEEDFDGDVECSTDCSCTINGTDEEIGCDPYYHP